jgi:hypothetical protein
MAGVRNANGQFTPKKITYKKVFYQRNIDLGLDGECYECTSHKTSKGYPAINRNGFYKVYRYIYYKCTGEKPKCVMHLCDNKLCINPSHLKGATIGENTKDMYKKGIAGNQYMKNLFFKKPEVRNSRNKLTELDVKWIKTWLNLGYKGTEIAKAFNVGKHAIYDIKLNKTWKNMGVAI